MYFTNTPSLNSMEAMMKRPPGGIQRGGGRKRSPYKYTGRDCDCRLCLYYRKKDGCTVPVCPVLDIRLACGAASVGDAVKAVFKDIQNTTFQKRLSKIYRRKDDVKMIFQNNRHMLPIGSRSRSRRCLIWKIRMTLCTSRRTMMNTNPMRTSRIWMRTIPSISRRGCIYEPQKRITAAAWRPLFL